MVVTCRSEWKDSFSIPALAEPKLAFSVASRYRLVASAPRFIESHWGRGGRCPSSGCSRLRLIMRFVFAARCVALTDLPAQSPPSADTVGASWEYDSQVGRYRVEVVATGVRVPFGMAFLPDSRALV